MNVDSAKTIAREFGLDLVRESSVLWSLGTPRTHQSERLIITSAALENLDASSYLATCVQPYIATEDDAVAC